MKYLALVVVAWMLSATVIVAVEAKAKYDTLSPRWLGQEIQLSARRIEVLEKEVKSLRRLMIQHTRNSNHRK